MLSPHLFLKTCISSWCHCPLPNSSIAKHQKLLCRLFLPNLLHWTQSPNHDALAWLPLAATLSKPAPVPPLSSLDFSVISRLPRLLSSPFPLVGASGATLGLTALSPSSSTSQTQPGNSVLYIEAPYLIWKTNK